MKTYKLTLLVLPFVAIACSAANKKVNDADMAELRTVKTIFIDGNNESADKLREKLETFSCFTLSNNKSRADAVMTTEERNAHD
jgi:hypothetical protein